MPRKGLVKPREVEPDPLFKNRLLAKLINASMRDGKKSVVQKEIYEALELIKEKGDDPIKVFSKALEVLKAVRSYNETLLESQGLTVKEISTHDSEVKKIISPPSRKATEGQGRKEHA